jgi:capsular polysaccharide biosynthesis protein
MLHAGQLDPLRQLAPDLAEGFHSLPMANVEVRSVFVASNVEVVLELPGLQVPMNGPGHCEGMPIDREMLHDVTSQQILLQPERIYRLRQAMVVGTDLALGGGGELISSAGLISNDDSARLLQEATAAHHHHGCLFWSASDGYRVLFQSMAPHEQCAQRAIFLPNLEPNNYGSFLLRVLPCLSLLAESSFPYDLLIVPSRTAWLVEALDILGLQGIPVLESQEIAGCIFRELLYIDASTIEGFWNPYSYNRTMQQLLRGCARQPQPAIAGRLFVSRRLSHRARPWYRPLINEADLIISCKDRGYVVVHPEALSLSQQILLFSKANAVIGPSGSGLLNSIFCSPGSVVSDLESFHVTLRQHAKAYASTGKAYGFGFGLFAGDELDVPPYMRSWQVPLPIVGSLLDWMESRLSMASGFSLADIRII